MGPPTEKERHQLEAVHLYENGMHAREVCRRFGINRHTLARWCDWIDFRAT